jgi:hypothetical protein
VLIDEQGHVVGRRDAWATRPLACRFVASFAPPVIHPAVMARREQLLEWGYAQQPTAQHVEDYELWSRLVRAGRQIANLPEPLLRFRISASSVSRRHEALQIENFVTCVSAHLLDELGEAVPREVVRVVANRVDFAASQTPLGQGWEILRRLSKRACATAQGDPVARQEIVDAARRQRVDIVLQCLLKGRPALRVQAGLRLLGNPTDWLAARPRNYLLTKLHQRLRGRSFPIVKS